MVHVGPRGGPADHSQVRSGPLPAPETSLLQQQLRPVLLRGGSPHGFRLRALRRVQAPPVLPQTIRPEDGWSKRSRTPSDARLPRSHCSSGSTAYPQTTCVDCARHCAGFKSSKPRWRLRHYRVVPRKLRKLRSRHEGQRRLHDRWCSLRPISVRTVEAMVGRNRLKSCPVVSTIQPLRPLEPVRRGRSPAGLAATHPADTRRERTRAWRARCPSCRTARQTRGVRQFRFESRRRADSLDEL